MNPECRRAGLPTVLFPALAIALGLVACSSSSDDTLPDGGSPDGASPDGTSPDGATAGLCGAGIPSGQACNAVVDTAPVLTPTCVTGTMPVGTGGTIVAGTYRLTAQTYYNVSFCPTTILSGTIAVTPGCLEAATDTPLVFSSSSRLAVSGSTATVTPNCVNTGGLPAIADAPARTFTASATALTFFTMNAQAGNPNPDRVEVYTRQ